MKLQKEQIVWGLLRLSLGWIFLWAFLDKTFGLGFSTPTEKAWISGSSPTLGFLSNVQGFFSPFFNQIAGALLIDWLFMLGLFLVGFALMLGICLKIAGYSGSLMMLLIWLSQLPIKQNPFLDDHIIYILILIGIAHFDKVTWCSVGSWWRETDLVKRSVFLK